MSQPTFTPNNVEGRNGLVLGLDADTGILNSRAIPLGMSPKRLFDGSPEERPSKFLSTGASPQLRRRTATAPTNTGCFKPPNLLEKLKATDGCNNGKRGDIGGLSSGRKSNRGRRRSVTLPSNQPLITSRLPLRSTPIRGKEVDVSDGSFNASSNGHSVPTSSDLVP